MESLTRKEVNDLSVLDLQEMKVQGAHSKAPAGSRTSKGCGNGGGTLNQSNVSLILCILVL